MTLIELSQSTHYDHSYMVSKISGLLAGYAGYSPTEAALIEQAALFHDIGKIDVPQSLLSKPSALSAAEYEVVKTHTNCGCKRLTEAIQALTAAITVASQHHERLDGSGYLGLSGSQIHPYAQLVAVVNVYEALSASRAYKVSWPQNDVCAYLKDRAGTQFDADIVALLLAHVDEVVALYHQEGDAYETH